ncbi:MAG: hypothetical protein HQ446_03605, partial [Polaromonas sp.]|nr:hypothetical protein [Polaromonas sp.]
RSEFGLECLGLRTVKCAAGVDDAGAEWRCGLQFLGLRGEAATEKQARYERY